MPGAKFVVGKGAVEKGRVGKGTVGVVVVNFGEPEHSTMEAVVPFLERIFLRNAGLESEEDGKRRAQELAQRRAPALIEEYESIGGSPLNRQAREQIASLGKELAARGEEVRLYEGYQFTEPYLKDVVDQAKRDGVATLITLPAYPLCGPSTTVAALEDVATAVSALGWAPRMVGIAGWHNHDGYVEIRARNILRFVESRGVDLKSEDVVLYFSAHGTPLSYLEAGSRYDRYVEDQCGEIAKICGARRWVVGFQNHANRGILWTKPDNEDLIETLPEKHLVLDAVSFIHEQSETLAELDGELRGFIEGVGKELHRVPVPVGDPGLIDVLADLVQEAMGTAPVKHLSACGCMRGAQCTNGELRLPQSPYGSEFVHA